MDICEMETQFRLLIGGEDFRARIEYFHDAIRALSSQDAKAREPGGRLSVELLAYDISCLRYIQSMPLSPFTPQAANLSPFTDIMKLDQHLAPQAIRPSRVEKERLAELYQRYAVLFAALLKPLADHDMHDRTDELNHDVQEMHTLVQQCEMLAGGKGKEDQLITLIHHLNDGALRIELTAWLHQQRHRKKDDLRALIQLLNQKTQTKDRRIAAIEEAHMKYALAQLAIYEESKDMIKKMAEQGMNLVGKFVESSIAQTKREIGR